MGSENPALEVAVFPQGAGRVAVPSGWVQEPATQAVCGELPAAEAGLALRHSADYTLVLRALRFQAPPADVEGAIARCGAPAALPGQAGSRAYSFRVDRLGVPTAVREVVVGVEGGSLLLELDAPIAKLPIVDTLYASWVGRLATPGRVSAVAGVESGAGPRRSRSAPRQ